MRKKIGRGNSTQEHIEKQGASHRKKKQPSLQSSLNAPFHQRKITGFNSQPKQEVFANVSPKLPTFLAFFFRGSWKEKKNETSTWGYGPECLCSSSTEVLCHYQDPKTWPARRKCNGKSVTHPFGIVGGVKYTLNIEHEVVNLDEYRTYVKHWDMS